MVQLATMMMMMMMMMIRMMRMRMMMMRMRMRMRMMRMRMRMRRGEGGVRGWGGWRGWRGGAGAMKFWIAFLIHPLRDFSLHAMLIYLIASSSSCCPTTFFTRPFPHLGIHLLRTIKETSTKIVLRRGWCICGWSEGTNQPSCSLSTGQGLQVDVSMYKALLGAWTSKHQGTAQLTWVEL